MKRRYISLLLTLALAAGSTAPIFADTQDIDAIKGSLASISAGVGKFVDALGNAWHKAAIKQSMKEAGRELTTNLATQILFAGAGITSFVFAGLGLKKLIDNRGSTSDQEDKKAAEAKKRERQTAWVYMLLGSAGCLLSRMAIDKIS